MKSSLWVGGGFHDQDNTYIEDQLTIRICVGIRLQVQTLIYCSFINPKLEIIVIVKVPNDLQSKYFFMANVPENKAALHIQDIMFTWALVRSRVYKNGYPLWCTFIQKLNPYLTKKI